MGIWCFSGFAGLFPLVFASIYWKRVTKAGAYASIVTTAATWIWLFAKSGYGAESHYLFFGMMPVATIVGASAAALVVVSLISKPPSDATLLKFFSTSTVAMKTVVVTDSPTNEVME